MVTIKTNLANKSNYGTSRSTNDIRFIVIHYTGNDGDSDENNGKYFHKNVVKASAHYFVDSDSITQSVPDNYAAYSVGGNYGGGRYYGDCTNSNSISIELCDDAKNGVVYPSTATINNALELTRLLMKKYNVPVERVIRHYDVNGKKCPAYWVDDNKWKEEFHNKLSGGTSTSSKPKAQTASVKCFNGVKQVYSNHVKDLQGALNDDYGSKLAKDGIYGQKTEAALSKVALSTKTMKKYVNVTAWVQCRVGTKPDGLYGKNTAAAVKKFQSANGITADGIAGINTIRAILKKLV